MRRILKKGEEIYSKPFACLIDDNGASKKDFERHYHMGNMLVVAKQSEYGDTKYNMEGNGDWVTINNELDFNKKVV